MTSKRSQSGLFRRFVMWVLLICAAAVIIFNMIFVLQTASDVALLEHNFQQEKQVTFSPDFSEDKIRVETSTTKGKQRS